MAVPAPRPSKPYNPRYPTPRRPSPRPQHPWRAAPPRPAPPLPGHPIRRGLEFRGNPTPRNWNRLHYFRALRGSWPLLVIEGAFWLGYYWDDIWRWVQGNSNPYPSATYTRVCRQGDMNVTQRRRIDLPPTANSYCTPSQAIVPDSPNSNVIIRGKDNTGAGVRFDPYEYYWWPPKTPLPAPVPIRRPIYLPPVIPTIPEWIDPNPIPIGKPTPHPVPPPFPLPPQNPDWRPIGDPTPFTPPYAPDPGPSPQPRPLPWPGPIPWTPSPQPGPEINPETPPVPQPNPEAEPKPRPWERPMWEIEFNPNPNGRPRARPRPRPRPVRHQLRPPRKGEKERKLLGGKALGILWWVANGITEMTDVVNAFYKALPAEYRRFKGRDGRWRDKDITPQDRMQRLYTYWDKVDMNAAIDNLITNQIEDYVIGKFGKMLAKASQQSGRPVGYGFGPWDAPVNPFVP